MNDESDSVVEVVQSGRWSTLRAGRFQALVAAALALDVATTSVILTTPSYTEVNAVLARLAAVDPAVALGIFVATCLTSLAIVCLSLGWLSTVVGIWTLVAMGTNGVSNLVLFATGGSIYAHLGLDVGLGVHYLTPVFGGAVALGWLVAGSRNPPWAEAVPGVGLFVAGAWLVPTLV